MSIGGHRGARPSKSGRWSLMDVFNDYPGIFEPISATGGTVSDVTIEGVLFRIHVFTSSGTFTVASLGTTEGTANSFVNMLVVAGGGGGGKRHGGGGGAGGLVLDTVGAAVQSYAVTVGGGGAGAGPGSTPSKAQNGTNSLFAGLLTANGGGGGGSYDGTPNNLPSIGGSGGGSADLSGSTNNGAQANQPGTNVGATFDAGNAGGSVIGNPQWPGGGGGGAGGVGGNANGGQTGGVGLNLSSLFGNNVGNNGFFAGGGGGAAAEAGSFAGGQGGGGTGQGDDTAGGNGQPNTGGGGGGARSSSGGASITGGAGGSGIVIIRYPLEAA